MHCGKRWCGRTVTRIIDGVDAVSAGPRRRFSEGDKAWIVSEAMMPGVTVNEVGRRNRV